MGAVVVANTKYNPPLYACKERNQEREGERTAVRPGLRIRMKFLVLSLENT